MAIDTRPASPLLRTATEYPTEYWNDSCSVVELQEAVDNGAVGATSNPVIVYTVVKQEPKTWQPVLDDTRTGARAGTPTRCARPARRRSTPAGSSTTP